jgi:hypothetical protein
MAEVKIVRGVFAEVSYVGEGLCASTEIKYMVPGRVYKWERENAPYFEHRLLSTRGGKQAFWASNKADGILNDAKYNPMVRGFLKSFMWGGPRDNLLGPEYVDDPSVCQRGSGVLNYIAVFWEGVTDDVRDYLESVDLPEFCFEQGHLKIFYVMDPPEHIRASIPFKNQFQPERFFNHFICGSKFRLLWRSIYGNAIGILRCTDQVMILSEDHEDQPVTLDEGWYILSHPFPRPQRPID